jgi:predicted 2-oxoglutarate/Fe(II)-dependent dioxygenase YbiX/peroxiredoxin
MLLPGDPAPTFVADTSVNAQFRFDSVAGRYVVVCLFGSTADPLAAAVMAGVDARHEQFDGTNVLLLAVTTDPADRAKLLQRWPGVIYAWDADGAISRRYDAAVPADPATGAAGAHHPRSVVLDQALRVLAVIPFDPAALAADHVERVLGFVDSLPPLSTLDLPAPVLAVPHVFEPDLCAQLIDHYAEHGGQPSGFMREVDGRTVPVSDPNFKRRTDCEVVDGETIRAVHERLSRRVAPAIQQAYQFVANRIERHIVGCYDAADRGHFKAHRDNTTRGTAHRRFAVSINLNTPDFEGGELWFPEFGVRRYKPPTGWAVVFSCSLLHEVTPVTAGRRFAFLPFLYDDAAAAVRDRNRQFVSGAPATVPGGG